MRWLPYCTLDLLEVNVWQRDWNVWTVGAADWSDAVPLGSVAFVFLKKLTDLRLEINLLTPELFF